VALKDPGALAQRMANHRARQMTLRGDYRKLMQQRRATLKGTQPDNAQRLNRLQKRDDDNTDDDTNQRRRHWFRNR